MRGPQRLQSAESQISQCASAFVSQATCRPSADHDGFTFWFGPLQMTLEPEPSAFTTRSDEPLAIAMRVASGDHAGPTTSHDGRATPVAIGRSSLPSMFA